MNAEPKIERVLMTTDTMGGVWTFSLELAAALRASGIAVGLATMGAPMTHEQREQAKTVPSMEVFESSYKLEWMENPWDDVSAAGEWLLGLAGRYRPDIVHLNGYAHAALPWQAPTLVVGHSCVLSWWQAVKGEQAPPSWDRYRHEVTKGLRAAQVVVAPSAAMMDALQQFYGPLADTAVIPNGRDLRLLAPAAKEPFVFAAGRIWDEAKNIPALDAAAPRLAWPVLVAGEDRHPEGGKSSTPNLRLLGRLSPKGVAAWAARASIYALPARYEPFGLSALEAAVAGCALVLGDIPSLREVWEDSAVFVPPNDIDALVHAINGLIADDRRRAAVAERVQKRALQYTPQRMADAYVSIYCRILRSRAAFETAHA